MRDQSHADEPLIPPPKLSSMQLRLGSEHTDSAINGVLAVLAALPCLSQLCLGVSACARENCVELSILAACPSLTDLQVGSNYSVPPTFTHTQLDRIRSSLGHLHRFEIECISHDQLARLLKLPVAARWQDIGSVQANVDTGNLLLRLPTLTKADLIFVEEIPHVDFLSQLPHLTALDLTCDHDDEGPIPVDPVLASLLRCSCITDLNLHCGFNSAHFTVLFAKLTRIKKLAIRGGNLTSLECFAAGPITQSLEELTLSDLDLAPSEVSYLRGLSRLRILHLSGCFSPSLDDSTIPSMSPPTPLLPALTSMWYHRRLSNGEWDHARTGRSFEWMQQQRSQ